MSATLATRQRLFSPSGPPAPSGPCRITLEQCLERAFAELRSKGTAECPLCRAPMRPEAGGGECDGCGCRLS